MYLFDFFRKKYEVHLKTENCWTNYEMINEKTRDGHKKQENIII